MTRYQLEQHLPLARRHTPNRLETFRHLCLEDVLLAAAARPLLVNRLGMAPGSLGAHSCHSVALRPIGRGPTGPSGCQGEPPPQCGRERISLEGDPQTEAREDRARLQVLCLREAHVAEGRRVSNSVRQLTLVLRSVSAFEAQASYECDKLAIWFSVLDASVKDALHQDFDDFQRHVQQPTVLDSSVSHAVSINLTQE